MRYLVVLFSGLMVFLGNVKALGQDPQFIQVEGLALGYFPSLADGVHVSMSGKSNDLQLTRGHRCFERVQTQRNPLPPNSVNFEAEDRSSVRNKLNGFIGRIPDPDMWLKTSTGLASRFYRENLAYEPPPKTSQLLFVPMVLAPQPVSVGKAEWTAEARAIMERGGWPAVERHCGTHFVETVGEETFVVYSLHVNFPTAEERRRFERVRGDTQQSPALVLNTLQRMRQRFEFFGSGREVILDVLQVGGRSRDIEALRQILSDQQLDFDSENLTLTRTRLNCGSDEIQRCQKVAQAFLDFQFGRYTANGEPPAFTPVRFRIAPLAYVNELPGF